MPRPATTRAQRVENVQKAATAYPEAMAAAIKAEADHGPTDPRTLTAWDKAEQYGAILHRQSRLLAGKSKGG